MTGLELVIDNGRLTGIDILENESLSLNKDLVIKLSDYCHTLCNYCFRSLGDLANKLRNNGGYYIIFVIDDKLKIEPYAFNSMYIFSCPIKWDIRGIKASNSKVGLRICEYYFSKIIAAGDLSQWVIDDNSVRKDLIFAEGVFFNRIPTDNIVNKYPQEVIKRWGRVFVKRYKEKVLKAVDEAVKKSIKVPSIYFDRRGGYEFLVTNIRVKDCMELQGVSDDRDDYIWRLVQFKFKSKYILALRRYVVLCHEDRDLMQAWKDLILSIGVK